MSSSGSAAVRWSLFLGAALAWRLFLFVGAAGSDDIVYSQVAWDISELRYPAAPGIHGLRLGYVGVIGFIYALFGAGTFSLIFFNLTASLAELVLAWHIAREFMEERGAWIAAALIAFLPIHVFLATDAHPDMPLAALTSLSVWVFLKARNRPSYYTLSGAVLGLAHLMKGSAFFGLAALLVLAGPPRPRHLWVLVGFGAGVLFEFAVLGLMTGDPLLRIHTVQAIQSGAMGSEYYLDQVPTLRRIFLDVPSTLFFPLSGSYTALCLLPTAAVAGAVLCFRAGAEHRWQLVLWPAVLLALLTFWPVTFVPYRPALVAHPRIFVVVAVPLAILAAEGLRRVRPRIALAAGGLLLLAGVPAAILLHLDARHTCEGTRRAFSRLPDSVPVVSDPRTIAIFRLYDGYADSRPWLDWRETPEGEWVKVVDESWNLRLKNWLQIEVPPGFIEEEGRPFYESEIRGRFRLRSLLGDRGEPPPPRRILLYRKDTPR